MVYNPKKVEMDTAPGIYRKTCFCWKYICGDHDDFAFTISKKKRLCSRFRLCKFLDRTSRPLNQWNCSRRRNPSMLSCYALGCLVLWKRATWWGIRRSISLDGTYTMRFRIWYARNRKTMHAELLNPMRLTTWFDDVGRWTIYGREPLICPMLVTTRPCDLIKISKFRLNFRKANPQLIRPQYCREILSFLGTVSSNHQESPSSSIDRLEISHSRRILFRCWCVFVRSCSTRF